MSYREDVPQTEGIGRFEGTFVTRPGLSCIVDGLAYTKGPTVCRVLPEVRDGKEVPWRMSAEPNHFSYWIRCEKVMRKYGANGRFTAFCRLGERSVAPDGTVTITPKDRNLVGPFERFANSITSTIRNSPGMLPADWVKWKDRSEKSGPVIDRPEAMGLLQVIMYQNHGKNCKNSSGQEAPQVPVVLMITKACRENLERACNTEVAQYKGDPLDFSKRFQSGDVCSTAGGRVLMINFVNGDHQTKPHYGVTFNERVIPIPLQSAASWYRPWDSLLHFMTAEEQINTLVQYFPPEAVDFVFGTTEYRDLLPQPVRNKWDELLRRRSVSMPAAGSTAPAASYQQPATPGYGLPAYVLPPAPVVPVAHETGAWMTMGAPTAAPVSAPEPQMPWDIPGASPFNVAAIPNNANVAPAMTAPAASQPFPAAPMSDPLGLQANMAQAKARLDAVKETLAKQGAL